MLNKIKRGRQSSGFTIIEVMIVLAIAGLILLIVFLAVPALQRNSRNTQRKNDVSVLLGAIAEFVNNNNGAPPSYCNDASPPYTFNNTASTGTTSEAKVGYYTSGCTTSSPSSGQVQIRSLTSGTVGPLTSGTQDYAIIATSATCDPKNAGVAIPGSARAVAVVYEIESGSNTYSPVCQSS